MRLNMLFCGCNANGPLDETSPTESPSTNRPYTSRVYWAIGSQHIDPFSHIKTVFQHSAAKKILISSIYFTRKPGSNELELEVELWKFFSSTQTSVHFERRRGRGGPNRKPIKFPLYNDCGKNAPTLTQPAQENQYYMGGNTAVRNILSFRLTMSLIKKYRRNI